MIRLADDIYTWRVVYRLTQQDAAGLANVHVNTWKRWEKGHTQPGEDDYETLRWLISRPPPGWEGQTPLGLADAPRNEELGRRGRQ